MTPPRTLSVAIRALERAEIPYALIGAMAMSARGVSRMTHDADLLVHSARALDSPVWAAWRRQVTIDIRRGEPDDPLVGVVRVGTPASRMPVDIVIPRGRWLGGVLDRARADGLRTSLLGISVPVVTPEDLVLLKLDAGGPGDRSDVHLMLEAWPERVAAIAAHVEALLPEVGDWARQAWARVQRERSA